MNKARKMSASLLAIAVCTPWLAQGGTPEAASHAAAGSFKQLQQVEMNQLRSATVRGVPIAPAPASPLAMDVTYRQELSSNDGLVTGLTTLADGKTLVAGTSQGRVLWLRDGQVVGRYLDPQARYLMYHDRPVLLEDGTLVYSTNMGIVRWLKDGQESHSYSYDHTIQGSRLSAPTIASHSQGVIVVGAKRSDGEGVDILWLRDGREIHRLTMKDKFLSDPVAVGDAGVLLTVGAESGEAFWLKDGALIARENVGQLQRIPVHAPVPLGDAQVAFVSSQGGLMIAEADRSISRLSNEQLGLPNGLVPSFSRGVSPVPGRAELGVVSTVRLGGGPSVFRISPQGIVQQARISGYNQGSVVARPDGSLFVVSDMGVFGLLAPGQDLLETPVGFLADAIEALADGTVVVAGRDSKSRTSSVLWVRLGR